MKNCARWAGHQTARTLPAIRAFRSSDYSRRPRLAQVDRRTADDERDIEENIERYAKIIERREHIFE